MTEWTDWIKQQKPGKILHAIFFLNFSLKIPLASQLPLNLKHAKVPEYSINSPRFFWMKINIFAALRNENNSSQFGEIAIEPLSYLM